MTARILVGCPTSEHKAYCLEEYVQGIKRLSYPKFDFLFVDNSKSDAYTKKIKQLGCMAVKGPYLPYAKDRIVASRNLLREKVLNERYDYFLSLEQDVIPPVDVIEQLLVHHKDVISGLVFTQYEIKGEKKIKPLLWGFSDAEDRMRFMDDAVAQPGLYRIKACGLGCILISRRVFEKISFRLYDNKSTFDDIPFCDDCHTNGITLFADTHVKCRHLISGMDWDKIDREEKDAGSRRL